MTGDDIRRERELRGLTAEQLSREIGSSRIAVYHWENGRRKPRRHFQAKLNEFFSNGNGHHKEPEIKLDISLDERAKELIQKYLIEIYLAGVEFGRKSK